MVLVSVYMGSYNHERYLGEAIESVLNQTFPDLELLIVDDYSTDGSRQIVADYAARDSRVKPIFHERNLGIARTANDALKEAKGKYLTFIGSDDAWVPNKLERQLELIEHNEDKIVWSEGQIIDCNGVATGETATQRLGSPLKRSGDLFEELLCEDFIFGQGAILKTEFAREIAFNEQFRYVNDHLFFVMLARKHQFLFVPEALAKYRLHGENITFKNQAIWFKERIMLRNLLLEMYSDSISPKSMADIYYKIGHAYSGLNQKESAKKYYLKALHTDAFHAHSMLFLILAVTDGRGFLGNFLQDGYKKVVSLIMQFTPS